MRKILEHRVITILLLLVFLAMFLYGMGTEEIEIVLEKSVNICLECIGIG